MGIARAHRGIIGKQKTEELEKTYQALMVEMDVSVRRRYPIFIFDTGIKAHFHTCLKNDLSLFWTDYIPRTVRPEVDINTKWKQALDDVGVCVGGSRQNSADPELPLQFQQSYGGTRPFSDPLYPRQQDSKSTRAPMKIVPIDTPSPYRQRQQQTY